MTSLKGIRTKWLKDRGVREAYEAMTPEYEVARALIAARVGAGLTQAEVARRMGTTQSVVARLEAGQSLPSLNSVYRYAEATGTRPAIRLVPA